MSASYPLQPQGVNQEDQERLLYYHQPPGYSSKIDNTPAFGRPVKKRILHKRDFTALVLSLACLAIGVASVASPILSWRLAQGTNQLIVLGFLLSIMYMCLASVISPLFLLIEARFGPSTVQNYEGLLRNQVFASRLHISWRVVLGLLAALPIVLSVLYKRFTGGLIGMDIDDPSSYVHNTTYCGLFAPPGVQGLLTLGVTLFFNATLPYSIATSPTSGKKEPSLPKAPTVYGYNVVYLDENSTAVLDIPQPNYIKAVQSLLADGESWHMSAPVYGTVATLNQTKETDKDGWNSTFLAACEAAKESSGAYSHQTLLHNEQAIELIDHPSPGDQSFQYLSIAHDFGINYEAPCWSSSLTANRYDVVRKQCKAIWSITRGGISILDGSCDKESLNSTNQLVITESSMFLGVWFMQALAEFLGPFANWRNESAWESSYYATATAAMLWSRMTTQDSAERAFTQEDYTPSQKYDDKTYSLEDLGIIYPVHEKVRYIRPSLASSPWLFLILGIQPVLTVITLVLRILMTSVPLERTFGLVAILSGINRDTIGSVKGASLSGKLRQDVQLIMTPRHDQGTNSIEYNLVPGTTVKNKYKPLDRSKVYQ